MPNTQNEIAIVTAEAIQGKIYVVRGQQVMLAADLADIYGYEHKAFNRQVRNNIERFTDDFRFRLTKEETEHLRCHYYAANISPKARMLPYVFTEQGIYMLMTVLKGDLAVQQSIALIRLFKQMKDYVIASRALPDGQRSLVLALQTNENARAIAELQRTKGAPEGERVLSPWRRSLRGQQLAVQPPAGFPAVFVARAAVPRPARNGIKLVICEFHALFLCEGEQLVGGLTFPRLGLLGLCEIVVFHCCILPSFSGLTAWLYAGATGSVPWQARGCLNGSTPPVYSGALRGWAAGHEDGGFHVDCENRRFWRDCRNERA